MGTVLEKFGGLKGCNGASVPDSPDCTIASGVGRWGVGFLGITTGATTGRADWGLAGEGLAANSCDAALASSEWA